jgi:hypothetical protein
MLSRRTEELLCRCARHRRAVVAARKSAGSLPLLLIFCRRRPSRPSSSSPRLARPWRHGGVQRWRRARPRPACAPRVGASAPAVAPCAPATAPASLPSRRPPIAAAESRRRAPPPYLAPTSIAATARTGRLRRKPPWPIGARCPWCCPASTSRSRYQPTAATVKQTELEHACSRRLEGGWRASKNGGWEEEFEGVCKMKVCLEAPLELAFATNLQILK